MKRLRTVFFWTLLVLLGLAMGFCPPAASQTPTTAFTYQGFLRDGGVPANGTYNLQFKLFGSPFGNDLIAGALNVPVLVSNGVFTANLDFGATVFTGQRRFLEIVVNGTPLAPRVEITPTPYAIFAQQAPWGGLLGIPGGFADGVDNDTTYSAGTGLRLTGTTFAIDTLNAQNGQVLTFQGGTLTWTDLTLRLPFAARVSTEDSAFSIIQDGTGRVMYLEIANETSNTSPLRAITRGIGPASNFIVNNRNSPGSAVRASTNGLGDTIFAQNNGGGRVGYFAITDANNSSPALEILTNGSGPALRASGGSLAAEFLGTVRMNGFQLGTSATAGHVLTADANGVGTWQPAPSPSGPAGGDLTGEYPNPAIANNAITTSKLADNAVTTAKIIDLAVDTAKIANNAVTGNKLASNAVTSDKIADGSINALELALDPASLAKVSGNTMATNGSNVGVGTANPTAKLEVAGGDLKVSTPGAGVVFPDGSKLTSANVGGIPPGYTILSLSRTPPPGFTYTDSTVRVGNLWRWVREWPAPRGEFAAVGLDGKIYVIGGGYGNHWPYSIVYNPVADSWSPISSPIPRRALAGAAAGGKIYAIGGIDVYGNVVPTVEEYNPASNSWRTVASMNFARAYAGAATVDGKIYVVGGSGTSTAEKYDPSTNTWTQIASWNSGAIDAFALGNRLYALQREGGSLAEYDPANNTWRARATRPSTNYYYPAVAVGGKIYVFQSVTSDSSGYYQINFYVYNPDSDAWRTITSYNRQRASFEPWWAAAAVDGVIYLPGWTGTGTDRAPATVEYIPPVTYYVHIKN